MPTVQPWWIKIMVLFCAASVVSAAPLVPDGSTQTTLDTSRNNILIVNIANPSTNGLSHNRYSDFNINAEGLILNNATRSVTQTQLGGYIFGNPQLQRSATVILNEVTSTHRSSLNGFAEVAGQVANLVIANPNGLTINGAGFINTSRVTLTTGKPVIGASGLQSLDVTAGDISIQGAGLNAKNLADVDIYTQFLQLNASLYAKKLDLKLGTNSVDYASGVVTASATTTSTQPLLLDSSLLGGMYANSIVLVGTDQGLGVNLPPEVFAATGNISINNNGDISLQKTTAKQAVNVQSAQSIAVSGNVYGETDVSLQVGNTLDIKALIAARDRLMLDAASINNHNDLVAGLNADGSQNSTGTVTIKSATLNNQGNINSTSNTDINVALLNNQNGSIKAGKNATLKTNTATLKQSTITAGRDLSFSVAGFDQAAGSLIQAGGNLFLSSASNLINRGDILANGNMTVDVGGILTNNQQMAAAGGMNLTTTNMINNGAVSSALDLTISANNLTNNQTLFAGKNMFLYTQNTLRNNPNANIFSLNDMTLSANTANGKTQSIINNKGDIQAYNGNMNLFAVDLQNITDAPLITGTFDVANIQIVSGKNVSITKPAKNCSTSLACVSTSVDTMVLVSKAKPATLFAGGNMNLNTSTLTNKYSFISASGNIDLNVQILNNISTDIMEVTTVKTDKYMSQRYCPRFNFLGVCVGGKKTHYVFVGTTTQKTSVVVDSVTATIQAGGNITGNAANLHNGNIKSGQVITMPVSLPQKTVSINNSPPIHLPTGNTGLFVVNKSPSSQYLIETNPQFTLYENFISSDYILQRLNYAPNQTIKRIGDAFYENKLIRDSILTQTGKRFLQPDITSDRAQFQYLMDNALQAQQDLQLLPGVQLTFAQIKQLSQDIVWMEEQMVDGQVVLVPVVYLANTQNVQMAGGQIIAGKNIDLNIDTLNNTGALQAGSNITLNVADAVNNQNGLIQAQQNLSITADGTIDNSSGRIQGQQVALTSASGDIINRRQQRQIEDQGLGYLSSYTALGSAGEIIATGDLTMDAAHAIRNEGSLIQASNMNLSADTIELTASKQTTDFFAGDHKNFIKESSVTHTGSSLVGDNIHLNAKGAVTVEGSSVAATQTLDIHAAELNVLAVNDSRYSETKSTKKGLFKRSSTTNKHSSSKNSGSTLSGGSIALTTTEGGIIIVGSSVVSQGVLELDSAKDIELLAGYDGEMSETYKKQSGLFTGGALYSKSEDLEGALNKSAVMTRLQGGSIDLKAAENIIGVGVNMQADTEITGTAKNITLMDASDEAISYSRHTKMSIGADALVKAAIKPTVKIQQGQISVNLATAEFSHTESRTKETTSVGSTLSADNISLVATADDAEQGNILIKGSQLQATQTLALQASNDVTIKEAKNTVQTQSKEQTGRAELNFTTKNEYVQIKYAVDAAKEAKQGLKKAKQSYENYKTNLTQQIDQLAQLKQDFADGRVGIEASDIAEMEGLVKDLERDRSFYKANIALATTELATKVIAVTQQMATAAESTGSYGFNAGIELDINLLEKKFQDSMEQSVGSNLIANNIQIQAGNTTTIQGSQLQTNQQLTIDSRDLNILAATDHSQSKNSSADKNINLSMNIYGNSNDSISVSANQSQNQSESLSQRNSQLLANNITINTQENIVIKGATIRADETLNLKTRNLEVASVQDQQSYRSRSKAINASVGGSNGLSSAGLNSGFSRSRSQQTVLTSLTGNVVNIDVKQDTQLKGAMIAAVDAQGNDNGNLNLSTNTLHVSSLSNRSDSRANSVGVGVGSIASLDFSNENNHSKTKTLATLGNGNIAVTSLDDSNTAMLNRDIQNNTVDIYSVESQQNLKGSVDTRLLSKKGRQAIKKDFVEFGMNSQKVAQGLPEADNGNAVIAAIGKTLDKMSSVTLGLTPSHGANGGLLGNIPVALGSRDINHKVIQVVDTKSAYWQANKDKFIVIKDSKYFKSASKKNQATILAKAKKEKKTLYVSTEPVTIDQANATYQNFTNGIMNSAGDAIKNAMEQAGTTTVTVNYNPSHGFIGDLVESGVDKVGLTTGIAKQTGEFVNDVTTARGRAGSNFSNHSQGNLVMKQGLKYQQKHGGFQDRAYFIDLAIPVDEQDFGIPTFSSFGSPVNTEAMKDIVGDKEGVNFIYTGASTKKDDLVGELLGGNKGNNGQMGDMSFKQVVSNAGKLLKKPKVDKNGKILEAGSPHSTYICGKINNKDRCGDRP